MLSFRGDVTKAVDALDKLGTGCKIINGDTISTVPFELSGDETELVRFSSQTGFVNIDIARAEGWSDERFNLALVCKV